MHRFGDYELHRRVGVGGMAEIWLATRRGPQGFAREVAVKRILESHAHEKEFVASFLEEARLLARFSHPNVVQVHEVGQVGETWYLAMEYVRGADLRTVLHRFHRQRRFPPLAFTLNVVADLCAALEHVHQARDEKGRPLHLVHRDVSPHNLLLSTAGEVKLSDFGIAKAADQKHRTRTGVIKGKVAYMAPEQVRGDALGPSTDIFQAGIVFYECLTLAHPFLREATAETFARIMQGKTMRPRSRRPEIPQIVEDGVRDAMRPRPEDRYPTAAVMRLACERILASLELPRGPGPVKAQMDLLFPELHPKAPPMKVVVGTAETGEVTGPTSDQRARRRRRPPPLPKHVH